MALFYGWGPNRYLKGLCHFERRQFLPLSSLVDTHYRPYNKKDWVDVTLELSSGFLNTPGLEIQHLNLEIQYFNFYFKRTTA